MAAITGPLVGPASHRSAVLASTRSQNRSPLGFQLRLGAWQVPGHVLSG